MDLAQTVNFDAWKFQSQNFLRKGGASEEDEDWQAANSGPAVGQNSNYSR